jgi:hypothetical protein
MERRRYLTVLRGDDLRCQRKWLAGVVVFYAVLVGLLGSVAWLGTQSSANDVGQTAMAGRIVSPHSTLFFPPSGRATR